MSCDPLVTIVILLIYIGIFGVMWFVNIGGWMVMIDSVNQTNEFNEMIKNNEIVDICPRLNKKTCEYVCNIHCYYCEDTHTCNYAHNTTCGGIIHNKLGFVPVGPPDPKDCDESTVEVMLILMVGSTTLLSNFSTLYVMFIFVRFCYTGVFDWNCRGKRDNYLPVN